MSLVHWYVHVNSTLVHTVSYLSEAVTFFITQLACEYTVNNTPSFNNRIVAIYNKYGENGGVYEVITENSHLLCAMGYAMSTRYERCSRIE